MKLKPGNVAKFRRRHDEIWPELAQAISKAGISDYSVFLDEKTLTLFALQKQPESTTLVRLCDHPIMKKWWTYMAPLMEVGADHSPVCSELKEVFHLEPIQAR